MEPYPWTAYNQHYSRLGSGSGALPTSSLLAQSSQLYDHQILDHGSSQQILHGLPASITTPAPLPQRGLGMNYSQSLHHSVSPYIDSINSLQSAYNQSVIASPNQGSLKSASGSVNVNSGSLFKAVAPKGVDGELGNPPGIGYSMGSGRGLQPSQESPPKSWGLANFIPPPSSPFGMLPHEVGVNKERFDVTGIGRNVQVSDSRRTRVVVERNPYLEQEVPHGYQMKMALSGNTHTTTSYSRPEPVTSSAPYNLHLQNPYDSSEAQRLYGSINSQASMSPDVRLVQSLQNDYRKSQLPESYISQSESFPLTSSSPVDVNIQSRSSTSSVITRGGSYPSLEACGPDHNDVGYQPSPLPNRSRETHYIESPKTKHQLDFEDMIASQPPSHSMANSNLTQLGMCSSNYVTYTNTSTTYAPSSMTVTLPSQTDSDCHSVMPSSLGSENVDFTSSVNVDQIDSMLNSLQELAEISSNQEKVPVQQNGNDQSGSLCEDTEPISPVTPVMSETPPPHQREESSHGISVIIEPKTKMKVKVRGRKFGRKHSFHEPISPVSVDSVPMVSDNISQPLPRQHTPPTPPNSQHHQSPKHTQPPQESPISLAPLPRHKRVAHKKFTHAAILESYAQAQAAVQQMAENLEPQNMHRPPTDARVPLTSTLSPQPSHETYHTITTPISPPDESSSPQHHSLNIEPPMNNYIDSSSIPETSPLEPTDLSMSSRRDEEELNRIHQLQQEHHQQPSPLPLQQPTISHQQHLLTHQDENLPQQFSPEPLQLTTQPQRFSPPPQQFSPHQQFSPQSQQFSPQPRQFSPQPQQFSPQPRQFSPQPQQFSPQPQQFSPQPQQFSPQPQQFSPQPRQYSPQPRQFSPQSRPFSPQSRQFSPQPQEFSPQPQEFSPEPQQFSPEPQQFSPQPLQLTSHLQQLSPPTPPIELTSPNRSPSLPPLKKVLPTIEEDLGFLAELPPINGKNETIITEITRQNSLNQKPINNSRSSFQDSFLSFLQGNKQPSLSNVAGCSVKRSLAMQTTLGRPTAISNARYSPRSRHTPASTLTVDKSPPDKENAIAFRRRGASLGSPINEPSQEPRQKVACPSNQNIRKSKKTGNSELTNFSSDEDNMVNRFQTSVQNKLQTLTDKTTQNVINVNSPLRKEDNGEIKVLIHENDSSDTVELEQRNSTISPTSDPEGLEFEDISEEVPKVKKAQKLKEVAKLKDAPKLKATPKIKDTSKAKDISKVKDTSKAKEPPKVKGSPVKEISPPRRVGSVRKAKQKLEERRMKRLKRLKAKRGGEPVEEIKSQSSDSSSEFLEEEDSDIEKEYDSDKDPAWTPFEKPEEKPFPSSGSDEEGGRKKPGRGRKRQRSVSVRVRVSIENKVKKVEDNKVPGMGRGRRKSVKTTIPVPTTTSPITVLPEDKKERTKSKGVIDLEELINEEILKLSAPSSPGKKLEPGDFVILKCDIGKMEAPIWMIDGKSLLQKFQPFQDNGKTLYRSSSTYSGWGSSTIDNYLPVKYLRKEKNHFTSIKDLAECIKSESLLETGEIENEIKEEVKEIVKEDKEVVKEVIREVKEIVNENKEIVNEVAKEVKSVVSSKQSNSAEKDSESEVLTLRKNTFDVYLQILISHVLDSRFIKEFLKEKDEYFTVRMKEVDTIILENTEVFCKKLTWAPAFMDAMQCRPLIKVMNSKIATEPCQACSAPKYSVNKQVRLFGQPYDVETLENNAENTDGKAGENNGAKKTACKAFKVCSPCSESCSLCHSLRHLKLGLSQKCQEKVSSIRGDKPGLENSVIMDKCLGDRVWVEKLYQDVLDLWSQCNQHQQSGRHK